MSLHSQGNSYGHSSRSKDRTRDRCVPRFRCNDAQSMQIKAPRFSEAHVGLIWSQSAQKPLPGICLIACTDAESAIVVPPVFAARAAFEDSIFCRLSRICCSIAWSHSSRSSLDCASKNHCLSKETMMKTFSSPSSSPAWLFESDLGVEELLTGFAALDCCGRRWRFFEFGVSIFPKEEEGEAPWNLGEESGVVVPEGSNGRISFDLGSGLALRKAIRGRFEPGILMVVRWRMISFPWESFS